MTSRTRTAVSSFLTVTLAIIVAPAFAQIPDGVSPGAADRTAEIEGRCPTFIWNSVPGAAFHELIGYRLPEKSELGDPSEIDVANTDQVLYAKVPGSAPAWEPELAECLTPGGNYVWFVRAVYLEEEGEVAEASEWSYGRYFSISSMPSVGEVEEALGVLRRFSGHSVGPEGLETDRAETNRPSPSQRVAVPQQVPKSVTSAKTAIKGTVSDVTGETYGVVGISNSPNGAGMAAGNTGGGADLVLDGLEDGDLDTVFTQAGIDRTSSDEEWFSLINSGAGVLSLNVEGQIVADGSGLTAVDADTLDGTDGTDFATDVEAAGLVTAHTASSDHDGRYFTESELNTSGGGGSVHWDNLTTVPAGLDDGDGDTTYTAGTGLQLVGNEFRAMGTGYSNVVLVASSGGDYTSIQAAIDSITDALASNPYLVWVAPGVYFEQVTLKPHVHLQGAGREATVIDAAAGASSFPPNEATLALASDSSVRDLAVENHATAGSWGVALLAPAGTSNAKVAGLAVSSLGTGVSNITGVVYGTGTEILVEGTIFSAENGTENTGFHVGSEASVLFRDVTVVARGGATANGVIGIGPATIFKAYDLQVTAESGSSFVYGLDLRGGVTTALIGGMIVASGSSQGRGIHNAGVDTRLEATGITVIAEDGTTSSRALFNYGSASAVLVGGSFIGRRGGSAIGIYNYGTDTSIETYNVKAHAHDADNNSGLFNYESSSARLHGGSFTGRGGTYSYGINSAGAGSVLYATGAFALGEGGSYENYGMQNYQDSSVILFGGSATGRGGNNSYGIYESGSGTMLEATGVTALSEDGATISSGLFCRSGASVVVRDGSFTGSGGTYASGLYVRDAGTSLDASGVVAIGEGGSGSSFGLYHHSGTSRAGMSQLRGGANKLSGALTCFQLYDGSFVAYSCP